MTKDETLPETDDHLADIARDVMLGTLETMNGNAEEAARVLLLAAAELRDLPTAGRGLLLSTMLMSGLDELRDDLITPPTYDQAAQRARLTAAARAGWRRGAEAARTGEPLRVPASMVEPVSEWLKALAPNDQSTP